jgi:hypothetical protein
MFGDKETQGVDGGRRAKTEKEKEKEKEKETKEDGGKEERKSIQVKQTVGHSTPRTAHRVHRTQAHSCTSASSFRLTQCTSVDGRILYD